MKKFIYLFLGLVLFLVLGAAIGIAYLYTPSGNSRLQKYVEQELREQTGLPVAFRAFRLSRGHLYFVATLGQEASLGFDGGFDLLRRSVNGRYLLTATHARYQQYVLRQARLSGHIQGTVNDLKLEGKGTLLNGPASYRLSIRDRQPRDVVVQLRQLPLDELLVLAGQPRIAQGKIDADILLPSIGKKGSKGRAVVQLADAHFDPVTIRKLYHYTLPTDKTALKGEARANLAGEQVRFEGKIVSDLLTVHLKNGQANLTDRSVAFDGLIDTMELAPLTQNRLHGPLKLNGAFKYDTIGMQGRAYTRSLGGEVTIDYTKSVQARIRHVSLARVLSLVGAPKYAEGQIDGSLKLDSPQTRNGRYDLKLSQGKLHTKIINKELGTALPPNAMVALTSKGIFDQGVLTAQTSLVSNLLKGTLSKTRYTMTDGTWTTHYRVEIPNPLLLAGKTGKGVPVTLGGILTHKKGLHLQGAAEGLGKTLTFDYADDRLKVVADDVAVGRLLASTGQPMVVSGIADAHIDLASLHPLRGKIMLSAPDLVTHPEAMKTLIGTPLNTHLSLLLDGHAKKGILFAKGTIRSPLMTLKLPQIVFDTKDNALSTPYDLNVSDLAKLESFIGTKLKGPFAAHGTFRSGLETKITGKSTSLGGTLSYQYIGTRANVTFADIPVSQFMHRVDQPDMFAGSANGTLRYDTRSRKGQTHLTIDRFQFKPGKLTAGVKLVLHKDLAQILYDRMTVDARFNGDRVGYKAVAHGRRSDFAIRDGKLNTQTQAHKASFGLRIDSVDVIGTIKGTIKDPKITVLPGKMLRSKLKKKMGATVKKEINKNVGATTKKLIKKLPKLF